MELADHGTDPRLWTTGEAEFHGEHVDFAPVWS